MSFPTSTLPTDLEARIHDEVFRRDPDPGRSRLRYISASGSRMTYPGTLAPNEFFEIIFGNYVPFTHGIAVRSLDDSTNPMDMFMFMWN